jgi:site-specific recombinase XerD
VWYDVSPLGHNLLGKMMSDIYEKAGIAKQCTNHSLRATAVHILDEAEFAGPQIMSITGHSKSVDSQFTSFVFNKDSRF